MAGADQTEDTTVHCHLPATLHSLDILQTGDGQNTVLAILGRVTDDLKHLNYGLPKSTEWFLAAKDRAT